MPIVNENNGDQPIRTGLSQIEREFQAVNKVSQRKEALGSILTNRVDSMASMDLSGGMKQNAPTTGGVLASVDRSKYDPTRAAAEDDIMRQARDRSLYASMNPSPQYGEAGPSGVLPLNQYHPSAGENIIKGYVQGSRIGSNPVFAAGGGLFPVGMLDARRQVMMNTASRNASSKKQEELDFDAIEATKAYEQKLNDFWWNREEKYMNEAFREFGSDAGMMLNNPQSSYGLKRKKLHQQLSTLGGLTKEIETKFNDKLKSLKEDETASEYDIMRMEGYLNGMNEELNRLDPNMTDKEIGELSGVLNGLSLAANQHMNMMTVYDDYMKNMKSDISRSMPQVYDVLFKDTKDDGSAWSEDEIVQAVTSFEREYMEEGRLEALRDEIWDKGQYKRSVKMSDPGASDEQHKQGILDSLKVRFPERYKRYVHKVLGDGSGSDRGFLGSKKMAMDNVSVASVPENTWPGKVNSAYRFRGLGRGSQNITWDIPSDSQVFYPNYTSGDQWFGKAGSAITVEEPMLVNSYVDHNGNKIEGWFIQGMTKQTPSRSGRAADQGVFETDKGKMSVIIPLHIGEEGAKSLGFREGNSAIQKVASHIGIDPYKFELWLKGNGSFPKVVQDGQTYQVNPDTGEYEATDEPADQVAVTEQVVPRTTSTSPLENYG